MAHAKKNLNAVNDALVIPIVNFLNGGGCIQYPTGGTGTIVVEVTADSPWDTASQWYQVQLRDPNDLAGAPVANIAAAGVRTFDIIGYSAIRARKSVTAGACNVTLRIHQG